MWDAVDEKLREEALKQLLDPMPPLFGDSPHVSTCLLALTTLSLLLSMSLVHAHSSMRVTRWRRWQDNTLGANLALERENVHGRLFNVFLFPFFKITAQPLTALPMFDDYVSEHTT